MSASSSTSASLAPAKLTMAANREAKIAKLAKAEESDDRKIQKAAATLAKLQNNKKTKASEIARLAALIKARTPKGVVVKARASNAPPSKPDAAKKRTIPKDSAGLASEPVVTAPQSDTRAAPSVFGQTRLNFTSSCFGTATLDATPVGSPVARPTAFASANLDASPALRPSAPSFDAQPAPTRRIPSSLEIEVLQLLAESHTKAKAEADKAKQKADLEYAALREQIRRVFSQ